jgi:hypothetical protein
MSPLPFAVITWNDDDDDEDLSTMSTLSGREEDGGEDVVSELGTPSVASAMTGSNNVFTSPQYKTVWDFDKIEKRGGPDAFSKCWHCGWCGLTLRGWNATKALNHVSKASGNNDVKACTGPIPRSTLVIFQAYRYKKLGASTIKRQHQQAFSDSVTDNQTSLAVMFESQRTRPSGGAVAAPDISGDHGVAASNATRLTSAIAEFVFSKGLPFSVTEGDHFLQILKLSRLVPPSYRPPH